MCRTHIRSEEGPWGIVLDETIEGLFKAINNHTTINKCVGGGGVVFRTVWVILLLSQIINPPLIKSTFHVLYKNRKKVVTIFMI